MGIRRVNSLAELLLTGMAGAGAAADQRGDLAHGGRPGPGARPLPRVQRDQPSLRGQHQARQGGRGLHPRCNRKHQTGPY